jgi:Zn-finger nucleic acid-binding protein
MTPTSPASSARGSDPAFRTRRPDLRAGWKPRTINCVKCPKCEGAGLVPLELGDILLDRCERCAGIWFDHGELEAVIGAGGAARLELVEATDAGRGPRGPCPRCSVEMQAVVASRAPTRQVQVDRCPSCMGLWLDRKRLEQIEDSRLLLTMRELFLEAEHEARLVAELPADQQRTLQTALELLRTHPQKSGLLVYLERESGSLECSPCDKPEKS